MSENLQDITISKLLEYNETDLLTQKEDQLKRLEDYIKSNPQDEDLDELNNFKSELETEIKQLKQSNIDNKEFTNIDLSNMLEDTKNLIKKLFGDEFFNENDTNPTIQFTNLGRSKLGQCKVERYRYSYDITTEISISNVLKKFTQQEIMNTIIHEYLHSLKCCLGESHYGKWKSLADSINNQTDYNIVAEAEGEEASNFDDLYDSNHKTIYHVICNNCGYEYKQYSASAGIVKNPENYSHRCPDGTRGTFKIDIEKR